MSVYRELLVDHGFVLPWHHVTYALYGSGDILNYWPHNRIVPGHIRKEILLFRLAVILQFLVHRLCNGLSGGMEPYDGISGLPFVRPHATSGVNWRSL